MGIVELSQTVLREDILSCTLLTLHLSHEVIHIARVLAVGSLLGTSSFDDAQQLLARIQATLHDSCLLILHEGKQVGIVVAQVDEVEQGAVVISKLGIVQLTEFTHGDSQLAIVEREFRQAGYEIIIVFLHKEKFMIYDL